MEVGIEDCLHIEFEYDKSKYHLKDTVVGKIYFLLARPRCVHARRVPRASCRPPACTAVRGACDGGARSLRRGAA